MATYEYKCENNGHTYTEVRHMSEEQKRTICVKPDCGSKLVRVYSAAAAIFKGKGFYSTGG
jgi:putative FmdB family regulatory protein